MIISLARGHIELRRPNPAHFLKFDNKQFVIPQCSTKFSCEDEAIIFDVLEETVESALGFAKKAGPDAHK